MGSIADFDEFGGELGAWKETFKKTVVRMIKKGATDSELREAVLESFLDYCKITDIPGEKMVDIVMKIAPRKDDIKEDDLGMPVSIVSFAESIIDGPAEGGALSPEEIASRFKGSNLSGASRQKYEPGGDVTYRTSPSFDAKEAGSEVGFSEVVKPPDDGGDSLTAGVTYSAEDREKLRAASAKRLASDLRRVKSQAKHSYSTRELRNEIRAAGRSEYENPFAKFQLKDEVDEQG